MSWVQRWGRGALAVVLAMALAGCGTPGAPQPPSLNLPDKVEDLSATRTGNQVSLTWTMPKKNTDKLLLRSDIAVQVCRQEEHAHCAPAGKLQMAPRAAGTFTETLPPPLASGAPRPLTYFVELLNRNGRSAGLSNGAVVLAGEAPKPVAGLAAEVRKSGVVLHWTPDGENGPIRLQRNLLTPSPAKPKQSLLAPQQEPVEQNLLVESDTLAGRVLDKDVHFGKAYEYRAQRVVRVSENGHTLELAGELSQPVHVEVQDIFPPAVPIGLVAVATTGENGTEAGTQPAIDLSWQPNAEADLAGYIVYRREGNAAWQRVSPAHPVVGPGFHDAQVQVGHSYEYAVSAVDQSGHESARSVEEHETVANP